MEVTCSSKTSADFQWTIWHYIPDDRILHFPYFSSNCKYNVNLNYTPSIQESRSTLIGKQKGSYTYRGVSESSQTRSKKKYWLNLLNFGCHLLQNSLLWNLYSNTIIFSMLQKHHVSHFPWCCPVPLAIPFGYHCFKTSSLQFHFQFGK
jgi:hypothetical protein